MPSYSRQPSSSTTTTPATGTTSTATATGGQDNQFLADLISGKTRLDGNSADWFARGVQFQKGMVGDLVKKVQEAIGAGIDGAFGSKTEAKLIAFQAKHGLPATGVVDEATWAIVLQNSGSLATLNGEEDFARMWAAHPHNYMSDASQNTSSEALRDELGVKEEFAPNTCALRMSTMLNRLGPKTALTTQKGMEAGLNKMRPGGLYMPKVNDPKTEGTQDRVIVSAREMWTYVQKHRGPPDLTFPPRGRYKTQEEAEAGAKACEAAVQGGKGLVAFDKILTYDGSGHVDLFDGSQLSDGSWYPSERIMIWFVSKGDVPGVGAGNV